MDGLLQFDYTAELLQNVKILDNSSQNINAKFLPLFVIVS